MLLSKPANLSIVILEQAKEEIPRKALVSLNWFLQRHFNSIPALVEMKVSRQNAFKKSSSNFDQIFS